MTHFTKLGLMAFMTALAVAPAAQADDMSAAKGPARLMALDLDGDGQITRVEAEDAHKARFDAADTDGSGTLSLVEMQAQAQARAAERAKQHFARLDANSDGQISPDERAGPKGDRIARMFKRHDANSDDVLDASELAKAKEHHAKKHGMKNGAKD